MTITYLLDGTVNEADYLMEILLTKKYMKERVSFATNTSGVKHNYIVSHFQYLKKSFRDLFIY